MPRKSIVLITCFVTLFWGTLASAGIDPTPFKTGLFGIAPGQAVRVSVLNAGEAGGVIDPCFHPDLAGFVLTVAGPAGRVLFQSRHATVQQGTGTFSDFAPALDDGSTTVPGGTVVRARRAQMHAEVAIELTPIPDDGRCADDAVARRHARGLLRSVHLTLEIYDVATGRTVFTMPFSDVMFNPQPEPPEPIAVP
jgi:hypothetical protein